MKVQKWQVAKRRRNCIGVFSPLCGQIWGNKGVYLRKMVWLAARRSGSMTMRVMMAATPT